MVSIGNSYWCDREGDRGSWCARCGVDSNKVHLVWRLSLYSSLRYSSFIVLAFFLSIYETYTLKHVNK